MKRPTGTIMKATLHLFPLTGLNLCVPVVNNYADIMWRCVIVVIDYTDTAVLRRRIYTEDKAKVVAAVWGTEFIPCRASYFPQWMI